MKCTTTREVPIRMVPTFNIILWFCPICWKETFKRLGSVWNFKSSKDSYKAWICIWRRATQLHQKCEQFAKLETDWKIKLGFMCNVWAHLSFYKGIIFHSSYSVTFVYIQIHGLLSLSLILLPAIHIRSMFALEYSSLLDLIEFEFEIIYVP